MKQTLSLKKTEATAPVEETKPGRPAYHKPSHIRIAYRNTDDQGAFLESENEFLERVENTLGGIDHVRYNSKNEIVKAAYKYRDAE
jgi:hypothetical protein